MNGWGVVVYLDGEPVTGLMPCDDWSACVAVAPFFVGLLGGPISVAQAVVANQPKDPGELTLGLFEEAS